MVAPALVDYAIVDDSRVGVYIPTFDDVLTDFEADGLSADVTRLELRLGKTQDTYTGWYPKSFETSTIKMAIMQRGNTQIPLPVGYYPKYTVTGFSADPVEVGDEIRDDNEDFYEIKTVETMRELDSCGYILCELTMLPLRSTRPLTSGTWATVGDPRYRKRVWLATYLSAANLTKDDGGTLSSYITQFAYPDYPMTRLFKGTKNLDLVFSIQKSDAEPLMDSAHSIYGYEESLPIEISAVDKYDITAVNLVWKAEQELRRITKTYPLGSVRSIERIKENSVNLGSTTLYSATINIRYKRGVT